MKELTDRNGCEAVIDFVGEGGALEDGIAMLRRARTYYVIGYGGVLHRPADAGVAPSARHARSTTWHGSTM